MDRPRLSKRFLLARLLHHSGALSAVLKLRACAPTPWLSILTYHRLPDPDGSDAFDEGVIDVTAEQLEQHVACLKRHFTLVGVNELCAFAAGGKLPANAVALTFDDGYLDNYTRVLPILRRHQCKAIFFVATSMVDQRRVYWWDRAAYLIKRSTRPRIRLEYPYPLRFDLAQDREWALHRLLRLIKLRPALDVERMLTELSQASGVAWSRELEREFADRLIMTWDHLRELRACGMDVQSHTRTHRVLQTLSPEELTLELEGSREDLRRELGEPARALAYPVGNPLGKTSPIRAALAKAGYEIGLTNATGPMPLWRRPDPFDFRRQAVGRNISEPFLLSILAIPPLAPKHRWQRGVDW